MEIKALAEKYEPYVIERRRWYHQRPELSGKEFGTIAQIEADIRAIGITDIKRMTGCNGLIADIHGSKPGKTLALRADIDALPLTEDTGLPFASENEGAMHACGHDAHIAIILGAARVLWDLKDQLCGTVRLLIQPSEEYPVGAKAMIAEGALDGVDAIYGNHIWGTVDEGKIDVSEGYKMATADIIRIKVKGQAAHGSAPNLGHDAITAAASIIRDVQKVVSRKNDPLMPMVATIGTIHGGRVLNAIADEVEMVGTTRCFLRGTEMEDLIRPVIEGSGKALGVDVDFVFQYMTPAVINEDAEMMRIARGAALPYFGEEGLAKMRPTMGGEDFSFYTQKVPGIYAIIGTRNEEKGYVYTNHETKYDFNEEILKKAVSVMAQFAADYLSGVAEQ